MFKVMGSPDLSMLKEKHEKKGAARQPD